MKNQTKKTKGEPMSKRSVRGMKEGKENANQNEKDNKKPQKSQINKNNEINSKTNNAGTSNKNLKTEKDLSFKSMEYRFEIEQAKKKTAELNKQLKQKESEIDNVLNEKQILSTSLLKLDAALKRKSENEKFSQMTFPSDASVDGTSNSNESGNKEDFGVFDSQNLTIKITGSSPTIFMQDTNGYSNVISSKSDLMKFLNKIYKENQSLRNFQSQVFQLSKTYDDINNNLAESINGFQEVSKNLNGDNVKETIDNQLKLLKSQIERSLETKQKEYSMLLEKREEDFAMLQEEISNNMKEIEQRKSEKENEEKCIEQLKAKIEEMEGKLRSYES